MKKSLLCLLLILSLLLTGCNITLGLEDGSPDIQVDLGDPASGEISIQIGSQGPKLNIDLQGSESAGAPAPSYALTDLPPYSGSPYVVVNNNLPFFTEEEITERSFEYYGDLDALGRCTLTFASIGRDLMPTEKRESIREVKPTGWHSVQYDWVDGKSLYNRCHLIGFQLAGENANEKNLITGTRSLNILGMLPFENMVADYVKETGNHVMYRVTPLFEGDNLVADGVLMEGLSVEDQGIAFCVFAYNAEPGVTIDYATGDSWAAQETGSKEETEGSYILNTGSRKFHRPSCPGAEKIRRENREVYRGSRKALLDRGYQPCGSCNP